MLCGFSPFNIFVLIYKKKKISNDNFVCLGRVNFLFGVL